MTDFYESKIWFSMGGREGWERNDTILKRRREGQNIRSPNMVKKKKKRGNCDLECMVKKQRSTEIEAVAMMSGMIQPQSSVGLVPY